MKNSDSTLSKIDIDRPKDERRHDEFGRYPFATRIARLIEHRTERTCYVIGIHGKWGEGKTTLLNFIQTELTIAPMLETLTFNPWRYDNTDDLLTEFYRNIGESLGTNFKDIQQIIDKFLVKPSGVLAKVIDLKFPGIGTVGQGVLKLATGFIPKTRVDKLKQNLGKMLTDSGKRIVIIIDDIDRLDSEEIARLFSLLKVNADISGVTYVVACDHDFVGNALTSKYGSSGKQFLEKLIQMPIDLPPFRQSDLNRFWAKGIQRVLDDHNVSINDDEARRFQTLFFLIKKDSQNPRSAQLHFNSFRFALEGMKGELNYVDLALIQWIRVAFPVVYDLIYQQKSFFLGYEHHSLEAIETSRDDFFKNLLKTVATELSYREWEQIRKTLFPGSIDGYPMSSWANVWADEKRICSAQFFDRYFHFALRSDEITESETDTICDEASEESKWLETFHNSFCKDPRQLITIFDRRKDQLSDELIQRIIFTFQDEGGSSADDSDEVVELGRRVAWLVCDLLEIIHKRNQIHPQNILKSLIERSDERKDLLFAAQCLCAVERGQGEHWYLGESEIQKLIPELVKKLRSTYDVQIDKIDDSFNMLIYWWKFLDKAERRKWVTEKVKQNPEITVGILNIYSNNDPIAQSAITIKAYQSISELCDPTEFVQALASLSIVQNPESDWTPGDLKTQGVDRDEILARSYHWARIESDKIDKET